MSLIEETVERYRDALSTTNRLMSEKPHDLMRRRSTEDLSGGKVLFSPDVKPVLVSITQQGKGGFPFLNYLFVTPCFVGGQTFLLLLMCDASEVRRMGGHSQHSPTVNARLVE
ncbi:unnamed protein product [Vitrella brassicaformis CCMP3155]|uniref:Uncharacterized protein n=1 Tax=Vitrella brassicaformis (strain CCMP3155) TaxID=1169540 RepID=A0A0G4EVJ1_VITBC|nr:unnamed protein product [Vitrella brassicaformis CCMP3155]|eukprot:CEM02298.1 unnamed protein product [Vitrella brassicaformis CCMP3155]